MAHICCSHLPLSCGKCGKTFCKEEELSEKGECPGRAEKQKPDRPMAPPAQEYHSPTDGAANVGSIFKYKKVKMNEQSEGTILKFIW